METEDIVLTRYAVFPGIDLVYKDVHRQSYINEMESSPTAFEISHCREGRMEYALKDEFCYLAPGDLAIAYQSDVGESFYFPLSHYHGVSIVIDVEKAPPCLSCFLDDVNVRPANLIQKFSAGGKGYIARSNESIEHIFSELYRVPDTIKKGYFKVKILELLLFLSSLDVEENETAEHLLSKNQVDLAKAVSQYLTEHMESRMTLAMLSEVFHVSGTSIKNSFKAMYGVSLYAYIRTQKMQAAALLLRTTDRAVSDIAGQFGYDNSSKFARAFKDVMGASPLGYRRNSRIV